MTKNKPPCIIYLEAWWWALKKRQKSQNCKTTNSNQVLEMRRTLEYYMTREYQLYCQVQKLNVWIFLVLSDHLFA